MAEMKRMQLTPVETGLPKVREFMQKHVANTYPVVFEGEIVGSVRGGASGKRWATLMDGECAVDIEVPGGQWQSRICDGSWIKVTASPRFEPPRGRIEWVVDEAAARLAKQARAVEYLGRGPKAKAREEIAQELSLPALPNTSLAGIQEGQKIEKILVLQGRGSQVAPDFQGALERYGSLDGVTCIPRSVGVQGKVSVARLTQKLNDLSEGAADLVVIIRGGGSPADFEDFNKRELVTAVHKCKIPVVTALGHSEHVPLAARAAGANFATPATAGEAIRSEVWKRRAAANRYPSYLELKTKLEQVLGQLDSSEKRRDLLSQRNKRVDGLLAEERQRASGLRRELQEVSDVASTEHHRALRVSLDCAVQRIRFTALVRGLWGIFWAVAVGAVLGLDQGASWIFAVSGTTVLAIWAAYVLSGGMRAQRIRDAHAAKLPVEFGGLERVYAELASVRTPRALQRWCTRLVEGRTRRGRSASASASSRSGSAGLSS